jgi:hypothetical protein
VADNNLSLFATGFPFISALQVLDVKLPFDEAQLLRDEPAVSARTSPFCLAQCSWFCTCCCSDMPPYVLPLVKHS